MNNEKCVFGLDLAAYEKNPSGLSILCYDYEKPVLKECSIVFKNDDIISKILSIRPSLIAVDAPLNFYTHKGKFVHRECEKRLLMMGLKIFPINIPQMEPLIERERALKRELKYKYESFIEVHPGTSCEFLGIRPEGNRNLRLNREKMQKQLVKLINRIPKKNVLNMHLLDSIISAYTGYCYLKGKYKYIGNEKEGGIIVPKIKKHKIAFFDIDGTITKPRSIWEVIHKKLGTWKKGKENLNQFLNGEIDYKKFADLDASEWQGISYRKIKGIVENIPLQEDIINAMKELRRKGLKIYLVSSGLSIMAEEIDRNFPVDGWIANQLVFKSNKATGKVKVNISPNEKHKKVLRLIKNNRISPIETVVIGDSEADIGMFKIAGLSIAYRGTRKAKEIADFSVNRAEDMLDLII